VAQRADDGVVAGDRHAHACRVERVTTHDPQPVMVDGEPCRIADERADLVTGRQRLRHDLAAERAGGPE
jgi:hypothetical protein